MNGQQVIVCGGFDDIRSRDLRFLEEAAILGKVTVLLWHDEDLRRPKFSFEERAYFLNAVRYVSRVIGCKRHDDLWEGPVASIWVDRELDERHQDCARQHGMTYRVIPSNRLDGFPEPQPDLAATGRKKVAVTGCYDWFHSGHVRFFEEASSYGDLYVFVGNDACISQLKGEGHPLLPQEERRYVVGSVKFVSQAAISSGMGWLDFDREIRALKPDILIVNEDGDKGGKREYCRELGIEYLVLKRIPAPGLPGRSSTDLRGY